MNKVISIGLVQRQNEPDVDQNITKTIDSIANLAKQGANIICLQELFHSEYFCFEENPKHFDYAITLKANLIEKLSQCAKSNKIVLIAPVFEKRTEGIYHNTVLVFDEKGELLGKYRKLHIPDDPGFYEKYYFTPGDTGYPVFETRYGKIGVLICWDQWYPEAARIMALSGAQVIFYPTAIGWEKNSSEELKNKEFKAWQIIQQSHAIANGVHIAAVNRIGSENMTDFWGGSFVSDPFGEVLYQASQEKEEDVLVSIDLTKNELTRQTWPFLRDRRIDTYQPIMERYLDDVD